MRTSWHTRAAGGVFQSRISIEQSQPGRTFSMPVDVEWTAAGRSGRRLVWLRQRRLELTVTTAAPLARVTLDPGGWLLKN